MGALSKMKVFAVIFALLAHGNGFKIATKRTQLITQASSVWPECADCPFVAKKTHPVKLEKSKQCDPDGTTCPTGCCPEHNWACCDDYCAPTAAECPFEAKKAQVMKLAKSNQCGPDETNCPAGCCPMPNWFCCPDNFYPGCAPTAADCP